MTGNRVGDTFTVRISGGLPKSDRPVCLSGIWVGDTFTVIYTGQTQERPSRVFDWKSGW